MEIVAGFGPLEVYIGAEEGVALTDVNGKYWSPFLRDGIYPIECCKDSKDPWCKFLLEKVGDHKVRMKDRRGVYLSRFHRNGIDFIEAAKNLPDVYCEFEVFVKNEKVLFRADNGIFLSLFNRGRHNIEAAKDGPDKYCEFTPTIGDIVSPKFEIISVDFMNVSTLIEKPTVVLRKTYTNGSSVDQKHKFNMSWTKTSKLPRKSQTSFVKIISVDFMNVSTLIEKPTVVKRETYTHPSVDQKHKFNMSWTKTESETTTWNHAWGLNASVSFEFKLLTTFRTEFTISYSGLYGTSSKKEKSITMGEETEVTIPSRKKITADLIVSKREDCDVPFTAKIKKTKSNGEVQEFMEQGRWTGVIYENVNFDIKEEDL